MWVNIKLANGNITRVDCYDMNCLRTACNWAGVVMRKTEATEGLRCPAKYCVDCPFAPRNIPEEYSGDVTLAKYLEYFETLKVEEA